MLFLKEHKKKVIIVIFIIVLLMFVNSIGTDRDYNMVEGMAINLLKPGFLAVNMVRDVYRDTIRIIIDYKNVREENSYLKEKVNKLLYNQKQYKKILLQNQRLRRLLNFKEYGAYKVIGASVISYSMDDLSQVLMVNRGKDNSIKLRMPVVAENGYLIGTISRVANSVSQVMLLNDPNFVTGGLVRREESRDLGVIKGQSHSNKLNMTNLSWDADIKKGDVIVTSGSSQYYPKGIPIGKVISVSPADYGLTQSATILPFVNFNKVEEVLVIKDFSTKEDFFFPIFDSNHDFKEESS